ncbi:MAG: hypothetical protein SFW66_03330 [Gammaproteobacteria bacterium]|nr:hypothetical protein [Gammaproteobacteria bacterium]
MLLIHLIKFIHVLFAIGLLGTVIYCFGMTRKITVPSEQKNASLSRLKKSMLIASFFAALTGTALIYPKHYTFHTHWIQAAIGLLASFSIAILCLHKLKSRWQWLALCTILTLILVAIIHDAVMKQTFF